MRTHLVLAALVLLSTVAATAFADTTANPPARATDPLAQLDEPWVARISDEAMKLLPRATRAAIPPAGLGAIYWGTVTDDKTWQAILAKDPRVLSGAPAIDFAKEALFFVLQDENGGGGGLSATALVRDPKTGAVRVSVTMKRAMLDIALTTRSVLLVRVAKADVPRIQLVVNDVALKTR